MRATVVWFNRLLWTIIAVVVVGLGAVVSLGRYYIDYLDNYHPRIIAEINRRTGLHIEVEKFDASWVRVSPQFTLENLRIFNPAKPDEVVISVRHLVVRVGLFQSLAHLSPVFSYVEGRGASAQFDEQELGVWNLRGFAGGGSLDALVDGLLQIHRADIKGSVAHLQFNDGRTAQLQAQTVQLRRSGRFRRLQLMLRAVESGAPLQIVVEAKGDPRLQDTFSARGYAEFAKVDLTPLLPVARSFGFDLTHGRIDGAAWLDWQPGGDISVRGQVALPTLDLAGITGRDLPAIQQISTAFLWHGRAGSYQLWLPRVLANWAGAPVEFDSMLIEHRRDEPTSQLSLPRLALADLHRVFRTGSNILPAAAQSAIDDLTPRGELRNLRLRYPQAPQYRDQLRLRAEIADLRIAAWEDSPGVAGLSGYVDTGIDAGSVWLDSSDASLDFPGVYHQPILFAKLRGALDWRRAGDRILVESGPLEASSDAGDAAVLLRLDLATQSADPLPPQMTLVVGMRNSAAQYRDRFIPYTLSPALLDWLGASIGAAKLPRGGFIYHGSLRGGDHENRSVQLFLDVQDGELAYHAEWPALHELNAEVWLDDANLDVHGDSARIFVQVALNDIDVKMRPQAWGGEWLTVTGNAAARDDDLLRVLRESAIRQQVGDILDTWRWRGAARARLALGIPLGGAGGRIPAADIRVDAQLGGGQMVFGDLNLTLDQVSGPLQYRSNPSGSAPHGLSSSGIRGRLFNRPAKVRIATGEHDAVSVHVDGEIAMNNLRDWLQQPLLDYAHGETSYQVAININGEASALQATSSLVGVTLDLPPPYAKAAGSELPLTVAMPLQGDRQVVIGAGDWADLALQWSREPRADNATARSVLRSGVLRLGRSGSAHAEPGRFVVTGQAPTLDFEPWRDLLVRHLGTDPSNSPAPVAESAALTLALRDLQLPEFTVGGQTLRDMHLSGRHRADIDNVPGWWLHADADKLKGELLIPDARDQPLRIDLVELHSPAPVSGESAAPSRMAQIDPATAIAADFHVRQFWRGDENWGELGFRMRPIKDGVRLDDIRGNVRGIQLRPTAKAPLSLLWQRRGDVHTTRFTGRLSVEDIGDVLERWGFEKSITSHSGYVDADVHWIGAPDEIGLKVLNGEAELNLTDGQFLKASGSATGALKVVGIFNFANLLRRLQLDFSDLFKGGVSFDGIEGYLAMSNGVFTTRKPIEISSPSSHFRLNGMLDFNTDQTEMELVATLPIASNLPWVAALAGGLPAAAGIYVASKLFQTQVDHFSSAVYDIRGSWREPEVKFRRIFDDRLPAPERRPQAPASGEQP